MELPSDVEQGWGKLRPGSRCGLWASMSTDSVLCCRSPSEQGVSEQPCELGTLHVGPSFLICDRREVQAPPRRLVRWGGTVQARARHRAGRVSVGWTHWAASRQLEARDLQGRATLSGHLSCSRFLPLSWPQHVAPEKLLVSTPRSQSPWAMWSGAQSPLTAESALPSLQRGASTSCAPAECPRSSETKCTGRRK